MMIEAFRKHPFDWLAAMLVSWVVPLGFFGKPSTYFTSLWFWLVPVALLFPRFYMSTDAGGRRRRAFWVTVGFVFVAGIVLDFVLGRWILRFDDVNPNVYVFRIPAWGKGIPVEEVLFYLLGGMAILLVYVWADEYWMHAYNTRQRRWNHELFGDAFRLVEFSLPALGVGLALLTAGLGIKWYLGHDAWPPPYYFTFIVIASMVPAMAIYRPLKRVVNWRAFSFTCLYVLVTSCIWEVSLGIAESWWWYQSPPAVIGWTLAPFGRADRFYPIEALMVWLVVSFDVVLAYEFMKGVTYDVRFRENAVFGPPKTTAAVVHPSP
jgi:hypothetical protein